MKRNFFNKAQRLEKEKEANKIRLAVRRQKAKAENERLLKNWLQSSAGKKYKEEVVEREIIATRAALDYNVLHSKYEEFTNWLADKGDI